MPQPVVELAHNLEVRVAAYAIVRGKPGGSMRLAPASRLRAKVSGWQRATRDESEPVGVRRRDVVNCVVW
jgi:hypothetical protein